METRTRAKTGRWTGRCPSCDARLVFRERLLVGEILTCDRCHSDLEVARLQPLLFQRLAKIEEEEEDFAG